MEINPTYERTSKSNSIQSPVGKGSNKSEEGKEDGEAVID